MQGPISQRPEFAVVEAMEHLECRPRLPRVVSPAALPTSLDSRRNLDPRFGARGHARVVGLGAGAVVPVRLRRLLIRGHRRRLDDNLGRVRPPRAAPPRAAPPRAAPPESGSANDEDGAAESGVDGPAKSRVEGAAKSGVEGPAKSRADEGSAKSGAVETVAAPVASASMTSRETWRDRSENERCHQEGHCNCWSHSVDSAGRISAGRVNPPAKPPVN